MLLLTRREGASITGRVLDLPQGAPHALVSVRDELRLAAEREHEPGAAPGGER